MICAVAVALTASKTYVCDLGKLARAEFPIPWTSDDRGGFEARDGAIQYVARIQSHEVWDAGPQFADRMADLRKESQDGVVTQEDDLLLRGWPALRVVRSDPSPTVMGTYISMRGSLVYVEVRGVSPKSLAWRPQVRAFLKSLKPVVDNPSPPKAPGPTWIQYMGNGYEVEHLRRVVPSPIEIFGGLESSGYSDRLFITGKLRHLGEPIRTTKDLQVYAAAVAESVRGQTSIRQQGIRQNGRVYLEAITSAVQLGPPPKLIFTAKTVEGLGLKIVITPIEHDLYIRCYAGPPCLIESPSVKNWFASFRLLPPLGKKG